jgi:hypothetical protein
VVEKRPPKILRADEDELDPEEEEENDFSHCSPDELSDALEGSILTDLLPLSTNGEITVSGIVSTRATSPLSRVVPNLRSVSRRNSRGDGS